MKIYTKTGDSGETSLRAGARIKKYDGRIEALGDLDELSSHLGLVKAALKSEEDREFIRRIQRNLFAVSALIAADNDDKYSVSAGEIAAAEAETDRLREICPPKPGFVLPGENADSARADIARAVARRAERRVVRLAEDFPLAPSALAYMNRLSDYLYALARFLES